MDFDTKKIKEAVFYLSKFKSQYMTFIINLNNGKDKPILINKKTELRGRGDPLLSSALAPSLLTVSRPPSAWEILLLRLFALGALKTLLNGSQKRRRVLSQA